MSRDLFKVTLIHQWSREKAEVPVEVVTHTYVSVRWGQSGVYDLNLLKNVLTARSQKAQRKGKPLWSALDIHLVRNQVTDYLATPLTRRLTERIQAQHTTLPAPPEQPEHISDILDRSFKAEIFRAANIEIPNPRIRR